MKKILSTGDPPKLGTLSAAFDGKVQSFRFPGVGSASGLLTPIDLTQIPLTPVRAFMVHASDGASRGGHAHTTGRQLLIRVQGQIKLETRLQGETHTLVLDEHDNAVLISAPVWSRQSYFGNPACIMVFCDTPYDPTDYIEGS